MKQVQVAIIGAGTAGLSARKEVATKTDSYVVIDDGPLGTTCARVGCMPSKVLIQVANDFARRKKYETVGIHGADHLTVDRKKVMQHVRSLRDRFVRSVMGGMDNWQDKLIRGRAVFVDPHTLEVNGETIKAEKIIIATGSRPIVPGPWQEYRSHLIDTDQFFEMETLPEKMAVIGLGVIGIEIGQALHNLGVDMVGITMGKAIGGLTDPEIQNYVADRFSKQMALHFNGAEPVGISANGKLQVKADGRVYEVDKALMAVGRKPNTDGLGLEKLNLTLDKRGQPEVDRNTMKLKEMPHIFLPGDVNADRPLLHEAADEGLIAGYNAVFDEQCFKRRTMLAITFSEPNIATVGKRYAELKQENVDFVTGQVSFEGQGRSIVKLQEQGLLHVYASKPDGKILGAEIHAPDGEHLAHLLAWAISLNLTVKESLRLPFYHPVIEEGLRTALRHAAVQLEPGRMAELFRCQDPPIR
ncbi:MAG: dihydrolipoyl dehydrogenase [Bdellovibrionales bacterium]